jgi:23S rRNA (adenine1618-N6)-methyltransferase
MLPEKKEAPREKERLHPRNKHRERYNFAELIECCPELKPFVTPNEYQDESIDFSDAQAVKFLNQALLKRYYGIDHWDIPAGYLCPPIPGRADYIHYIADLLAESNHGEIPTGNRIHCLDIGVGANCIYPMIGTREYGWSFVGSDIDPKAIAMAKQIVQSNTRLKGKIECRIQYHTNDIFKEIIREKERFAVSICNPPFHASQAEAQAATLRKLSNLNHQKITKPILNFGGQNNELWCGGGEEQFVRNMIIQSKQFSASCCWFTSLISKQSNLSGAYKTLEKVEAAEVKTIAMGQGNKTSRILAWTFMSAEERKF